MSIFLIVVYILLAAYCALFLIYSIGWYLQKMPAQLSQTTEGITVSVIIPARNEEATIGHCLQSLLQQTYPKHLFQVIVIDDFSEDNTAAEVQKFIAAGGNVQIIKLSDHLNAAQRINAYKKEALCRGIESGNGRLIITTDADCTMQPQWLSTMVSSYASSDAEAVIAPVSFTPVTNLCTLFQSLDFMTMQGITASAHKLRLGNMANGANFAFSRHAWTAVNGYTGSETHASGDDYHLLYKIRKQFPNKIHYLKSRDAIVSTPPQPTWKSFLQQRIRWASKSGKYPDHLLTAILLIVYLFNCSLFALAVIALFCPALWMPLLTIIVLKTIIELLFLLPVSRFFSKTRELILFPLLQPLHIFYIVLAGFLGMIGGYTWKDRKVT